MRVHYLNVTPRINTSPAFITRRYAWPNLKPVGWRSSTWWADPPGRDRIHALARIPAPALVHILDQARVLIPAPVRIPDQALDPDRIRTHSRCPCRNLCRSPSRLQHQRLLSCPWRAWTR
jgi:hypothetical protein